MRNRHRLSAATALLGLVALWVVGMSAHSQDVAPPEGVEVLARGPVHEAFAEPSAAQPQPGPVITKQPPEAVEELPPDQKPEGDHVQWIPGYWSWDPDTSDFIWISGFWRDAPPGRRWLPGHWQQVDGDWMWVAGLWATANVQEVQYLPPPPPSIDRGPSAPADEATNTYVPGTWVYQETRFLWRPGHWIGYRPGWVWISAHYDWTPSGCLFVDGYWDHPLDERGLLFAPVRFTRDWWRDKRRFVPQFVVAHDFMMGALFVGPTRQHYYFGDYFDDSYAKRGFLAWPDYRLGKGAYDPNFNYYRHLYAAEPRWETGLRALYTARRSNEVPRPPRTLVQQVQTIKTFTGNRTANVVVHKNIHITNVQSVTALTPLRAIQNTRVTNLGALSQVKETRVVPTVRKLQVVPKEELVRHQQAAVTIQESARIRREGEAKLLAQGGIPVKHTDPARTVKLVLPKQAEVVIKTRPGARTPPPNPVLPRHIEQPIPKYDPRRPPEPPRK